MYTIYKNSAEEDIRWLVSPSTALSLEYKNVTDSYRLLTITLMIEQNDEISITYKATPDHSMTKLITKFQEPLTERIPMKLGRQLPLGLLALDAHLVTVLTNLNGIMTLGRTTRILSSFKSILYIIITMLQVIRFPQ